MLHAFLLLNGPAVGDPPYVAEANIGTDKYIFYLNVCGETKAGECKDDKEFVSSCQVKKDKENVNKVAGRYQNQTLRWVKSDFLNCRTLYNNLSDTNYFLNASDTRLFLCSIWTLEYHFYSSDFT